MWLCKSWLGLHAACWNGPGSDHDRVPSRAWNGTVTILKTVLMKKVTVQDNQEKTWSGRKAGISDKWPSASDVINNLKTLIIK